MVYLLNEKISFPDPRLGEEDGLLAVGGDLSVERLLLAYSNGIFPWYSFRDGEKLWYCPMRRFVIFPNEIHISHSMRTLLNKGKYTVSVSKAFEDVIQQCSQQRIDEPGAWLGEEMIKAYTELHRLHFAESIEVWEGDKLVGGLYGVCIHGCFFGESMFSLVPSASKIALIALANFMLESGGKFIDCQFETPHLKSMGGHFIDYEEYMEIMTTDSEETSAE